MHQFIVRARVKKSSRTFSRTLPTHVLAWAHCAPSGDPGEVFSPMETQVRALPNVPPEQAGGVLWFKCRWFCEEPSSELLSFL